jgi:hypothetical protein
MPPQLARVLQPGLYEYAFLEWPFQQNQPLKNLGSRRWRGDYLWRCIFGNNCGFCAGPAWLSTPKSPLLLCASPTKHPVMGLRSTIGNLLRLRKKGRRWSICLWVLGKPVSPEALWNTDTKSPLETGIHHSLHWGTAPVLHCCLPHLSLAGPADLSRQVQGGSSPKSLGYEFFIEE